MYRKRLKNVYELLESGNNKKVIQEVDKLVSSTASLSINSRKKLTANEVGLPGYDEQTTLIIAKALKALALVRTGRKSDSDKLIDELLNSQTTDENALNIIMQYCKETHQLTKIVAFYENAALKLENDKVNLPNKQQEYEEILVSLFNAYTRNRDFKKQQQLALKLYKQNGKIIYSYWNAASYVLLAKDEIKSEQKNFYLKLAEKLLEKAYLDKKMEFNGEFQLYLDVLESSDKYTDALRIINEFDIDKHKAKIGHPNFKFNKQLLYFKKLNDWISLKGSCEKYFMEYKSANLQDWNVFIEFIQSSINILKCEANENSRINKINDILNFLKNLETAELSDMENENIKISGPCCAQIEFIDQITLKNDIVKLNDSILDNLKMSLSKYIDMCSCQPGFFYEISRFDNLIREAKLENFLLDQLKSMTDKCIPFTSIKSIYTCITYWQLNRFFSKQENLSNEELLAIANKLEEYYLSALPFGKDLLPTAFQYADEFLILASHIRYDILVKSNDSKCEHFIRLISNLKFGLTKSPTNFQIKLILLNIYSQLGAFDSIRKMYDSMEIKNIQFYSTSNLLTFNNMRLGSYESSTQIYATMSNFFTSGLFDLTSFMVNCYKYGTFLKAFEVNSFINELSKSLSLHVCLTNNIMQQIVLDQVHAKETTSGESNEIDVSTDLLNLVNKIEQFFQDLSQLSNVLNDDGLINSVNEKYLIDHSDTNVLYDWSSQNKSQNVKNNRSILISEQIKLLKLRLLMVKFVQLNIKSEKLNDKFDQIGKEINNFDYSFSKNPTQEIFNTHSSYLSRFSQLGLNKLINTCINLTIDLKKNEQLLEDELQNKNNSKLNFYKQEFVELFRQFDNSMLKLIEQNQDNTYFKIEYMNDILECISSFLECLSFVIVNFITCLGNSFFKPIWLEKCKKQKKKKGAYLKYHQSIDCIYEIYESICDAIIRLLANFDKFSLLVSLVESKILTFENRGNFSNFKIDLNDLIQSYKKSFDELRKIYNSKVKYLNKFGLNQPSK